MLCITRVIYFKTGSRSASAHYFVDNTNCYQSVALKNAAWAVGGTSNYKHTECRNSNSISIEMCCSGNYQISETTEINAAYLCAALCKYLNISANQVDTYVLRHWDVWAKSCPAGWTGNNNSRWNTFKSRVKSILNGSEDELMSKEYDELKGRCDSIEQENTRQNGVITDIGTDIVNLQHQLIRYDYIDENMPDWAKPTIQKLVNKGFLKGEEDGRLNLTEDIMRLLVINDRAGLYGE